MSIDLRDENSPKAKLLEWCDFYTKTLAESGGNDLAQIELVEDDWDTRFLFLATHYYLFRLSEGERHSGIAKRFLLPLYANLVMNTYNMLIQFGVKKDDAFSFVPNFHIRQYDYLIFCTGAFNEYQDNDLDGNLMASWFSTTAEDLVDQNSYLGSEPQTHDQFLKRGNARRASEDYKGAIDDYSKAIALNPTESVVYTYRGIAHELLEDYESANEDYSAALMHDPGDTNALRFRAFNKLTMLDDKEGALEDYSKAIDIDPNDCDLYNRRSMAYIPAFGIEDSTVDDFSSAIDDLLMAKEIDPDKGSSFGLWKAYEGRADLFLKGNRFADAIEDYDKAIQIGDSRKLLTKRANAKQSDGDLQGACQDWKDVLKVDWSKYDTDDSIKLEIKEAIESLRRYGYDASSKSAVENNRIANDYKVCGDQKANSGDLLGAISEYTKSIDIDPSFWRAYNNRGNARAEIGDFDAAFDDFHKSIDICPTSYHSYLNISRYKFASGEFGDAIKYSSMAIVIDPNVSNEQLYSIRAMAKLNLEDFDGSVDDIKEALKINPSNAQSFASLALARSGQDDHESALMHSKRSLGMDPLDLYVIRLAGSVEWNAGNSTEGRSYWERAGAMGDKLSLELLNQYIGSMSEDDLNRLIEENGGADKLQDLIDWAEKNQKEIYDNFLQQFSEATTARDLEHTRSLLDQFKINCAGEQ